jgi:hypothetical protein
MARRSTAQNKSESPVEETTSETTEAPVEETTEESTETTEKAEATPVDLTAFKAAAEEAVAGADESTGDVTAEGVDALNKVYREIDGVKGKNQARGWLEDQMKAAIVGRDIIKAKAYVMLKDGLSAGSGGGAPRPPADPTLAFTQRVTALQLALTEVTSHVPEGVGETWAENADKLVAELDGEMDAYREFLASDDEDAEAPEVSPVVRQAFKLAAGRGVGSGASRSGPRRDIEKHLVQVFSDKEVGSFLTVNEIAKASSTEYGDDRPSAGAVSARLFPKGRDAYSANGIEASAEEGKPRGARKTA